MASPLSDAEKLTVLRAKLILSGRQIGKTDTATAMLKFQLQQFQNNPPQG